MATKVEPELGRKETAREVEARAAIRAAREQQDAADAAMKQAMTELREARAEGDRSLPQITVRDRGQDVHFVILKRTSATIWARRFGEIGATEQFRFRFGIWQSYPSKSWPQHDMHIRQDSPGLKTEDAP